MTFNVSTLHSSTIWQLYRLKDRIQIDPEYQRLGGIWAPETRSLLIDTILNGFDVPKLYMHKFTTPFQKGGKSYDYAIIDGKQRLEAIWNFIEGHLSLAEDFKLFKDENASLAGMKYQDLGKTYPDMKSDFDGYLLSVVLIETDDFEMIEEMFSRLNEAAPLTAPEKRNAYGGPLPGAIRKLAKEAFFGCLPFPNNRYRHFDLAVKFLLSESAGRVVDTKKAQLDDFVSNFSGESRTKSLPFFKSGQATLASMSSVFTKSDPLLRQVGMVALYHHLFRVARDNRWAHQITRKNLVDFEKRRVKNREYFEAGTTNKVDKDLIGFDGYSQSPNDAGALRFRLRVILDKAFGVKVAEEDL